MNSTTPNYTEVPAASQIHRVQVNPAPKHVVATTIMNYEAVKHLLSSKPLRRPTRSTRLGK